MNMHNPAHPGELLTGWLDDLDVSVTAFSAHIGISRVMLSRVLHGHAAVSADMDLRLSEALGTSPGYWLALQIQRDLWTARPMLRPGFRPRGSTCAHTVDMWGGGRSTRHIGSFTLPVACSAWRQSCRAS